MAEALETTTQPKWENVNVERKGKVIVLPEKMEYDDAIKWLQRKRDEENQPVRIWEEINAYPMDGAIALTKAIARKYGWTQLVPKKGFFGDTPPQMVGVQVSPTETVQVPWGVIQIPGVSGEIYTEISEKNGMAIFAIGGEVLKKHAPLIAQLAADAREIVRNESIYRGKAIRVSFPPPNEVSPSDCPSFIDTRNVRPDELIFPEKLKRMIQTSLFNPVEHTEKCRKYKIPLKRGILLEGPYGCGKTLTAYVTAKKCEDNGWTFIYLENVAQLKQAIYFANQYAPAVIFAEDIDRVLSGERSSYMDEILNTIDGVESKNSEVLVCLTTNHLENINQAMLRPGRLDSVISVSPPDAEAVQRLIRLYARGLIDPKQNLKKVGEQLDGQIPAVIREVVERSKLEALSHLDPSDEMTLQSDDIYYAAESMLHHIKLLKPKEEDTRSDMEKLGDKVKEGFTAGLADLAGAVRPVDAVLPRSNPNGSAKRSRA